MAKGLALPVKASGKGGAILNEGDEHADQIIRTALGDCDSEHAFQQDIGIGSGMIFDIDDENMRAKVLRRLFNIFRLFENEKLFKLQRDSIKWSSEQDKGETTLEFKYINLESDETKTFVQSYLKKG